MDMFSYFLPLPFLGFHGKDDSIDEAKARIMGSRKVKLCR